ncbi:hypothetical protein Pmani_023112 [Petrolisthes manimaculis]|uniref:Nucleolar GTP-binding protein 2 n=1 Tax=Petrolisthes manimaculis TaxID=1843537 RepID=A0AAE1U3Q7_9EUCA|nr:hypothetical protein Pmani_023112 [Petrolisthes manimaculis]
MGKTLKRAKKKEGFVKSNNSMNPDRPLDKVKLKGAPYARDKTTIKRLQMYRSGKPKRNRKGKIVQAASFQNRLSSGTRARVAPNQRWFGNTRVIGQKALHTFQEEMGKVIKDPYQVVMRKTILPISLLNETAKNARVHILDTEPYDSVFGKRKTRKKPSLKIADFTQFAKVAEEAVEKYDPEKDLDLVREAPDNTDLPPEWFMKAGQSKRIWNELYKVIDSSDVLIQVLDARDPLGTRSKIVEKHLRKEAPHKHLIFVLNKVDLVPVWVTQKWVAILSSEYPTLAFHSSITNPYGKGALINILRQFGKLHEDKKQISVGLIGFPNVGKSSIINTMKKKKVCNVAPLAGETKVWQYVTLFRKIYLVDCPGIVPPSHETPTDMVLKGAVRTEYLKTPSDFIAPVLERVKREYIIKTYRVDNWSTPEEFMEQVARRSGKLLKGGEPDFNTVAKMILNDWQRGKIPFFVPPPGHDSSNFMKLKKTENEEMAAKVQEKEDEEDEALDPINNLTNPIVYQNYKGIYQSLQYTGDDVRPLEEFGQLEYFDEEEELEDEEEEGEGNEKENEGEEEGESKTEEKEGNSKEKGMEGSNKESEKDEESIEYQEKGEQQEVMSSVEQNNDCNMISKSKENVSITDRNEEDGKEEIQVTSDVQSNGDEKLLYTGVSQSDDHAKENGNHSKKIVSLEGTSKSVDIGDENKSGQSSDEEDEMIGEDLLSSDEEVYTSAGQFSVTPVRKLRRKRKRRPDEEGPEEKTLTSKQRRRIEREQKPKKIGVHYYEYANVKNRNRDKVKPGLLVPGVRRRGNKK